MKRLDLVGQKFGRLEVKEFAGMDKRKQTTWKCECACGNIVIVSSNNLRRGLTKSCGCINREMTRARNFIDLTGERYGMLVVLGLHVKNKHGQLLWKCKCDCGNIIYISSCSLHKDYVLKNGNPRSCGCSVKLNLVGRKFGKLLVKEFAYTKEDSFWKCICDCGNETTVCGSNLNSGHTKSCGCLNYGKNNHNYKHGLSQTRGYKNAYKTMYKRKRLNQTPKNADLTKIRLYYIICAYLNKSCEKPMWHVDHIKPLSKGGLHHEDNLQILTAAINLQKSDSYPLTAEEKIQYGGLKI